MNDFSFKPLQPQRGGSRLGRFGAVIMAYDNRINVGSRVISALGHPERLIVEYDASKSALRISVPKDPKDPRSRRVSYDPRSANSGGRVTIVGQDLIHGTYEAIAPDIFVLRRAKK